MRFPIRFSLLVLFAFWGNTLLAQDFYRFKSDFSIKEKETSKDQGRLITGTIYYDKNLHKTVYNIRFPEPEQWLVRDTFMYRIKADTLVSQQMVPSVGEFSIFNLILSQQLNDFGLAKMGYTPGDVQQDENQVISQWLPPELHRAKRPPSPGENLPDLYPETGEFVRIMTLKNIIINQADEDSIYDFSTPAGG